MTRLLMRDKEQATIPHFDSAKVQQGVYLNMSREDYDAIDAANQSRLKRMLKASPAHARHDELFPGEPGDSLILGTAWHTLFLEGSEKFDAEYAIWMGKIKRGKEWDGFLTDAEGRVVLTHKQAAACLQMATSLAEHETARRLFQRGDGVGETVLIWDEIEPDGVGRKVRCKARLDRFIADDAPTIADLKSASSTVPQDLQRSIANFGYDFQGNFYRRGATALGYPNANVVLAFIDTGGSAEYPKPTIVNSDDQERYPVRVVELDDKALARGGQLVDAALDLWHMCLDSGKWESYPDRIESIGVPQWAINEMER